MSELVLLKNGDLLDELELQLLIFVAMLNHSWITPSEMTENLRHSAYDCERAFVFDTFESLFEIGCLTRGWINKYKCFGYTLTEIGVSRQIFLIEYFKSLRAHQRMSQQQKI